MKNFICNFFINKYFILSMLLMLLLCFLYPSLPIYKNVLIEDSNGNKRHIKIPVNENSKGGINEYTYTGTVYNFPWSPNWVNIIADDSVEYLEIDGKELSLENIKESERSDWSKGFHLDWKEQLEFGRNTVKIKVKDTGGKYGLKLLSSYKDKDSKRNTYISVIILLLVIFFIYQFLIYLHFSRLRALLIATGLPVFIYILMTSLNWTTIVPQKAIVKKKGEVVKSVDLPVTWRFSGNDELLTYTCIINYHRWSQEWIYVIPDDQLEYLKVNGKKISLEGLKPRWLSDYTDGFHLNLGKHLDYGKNIVHFGVRNHGGMCGLKLFGSYRDVKRLFLVTVPMFLLFSLVYNILRHLQLTKSIILLLLSGLLLRIIYLLITPHYLRAYDLEHHISYAEYILNSFFLPSPEEGFLFFHPPLYYILSAIVCLLVRQCSSFPIYYSYNALQVFSLLASLAYTIVSVFIFKKIIDRVYLSDSDQFTDLSKTSAISAPSSRAIRYKNQILFVTSMIFIFWPYSIIDSIRISNDMLLNMFYSLGLLFLIEWSFGKDDKKLYLSVIFGVLALITKTNGLILLALIGIVFLFHFFKSDFKLSYIKKIVIIGTLISIGLIISFGSSITSKLKGSSKHILVRNSYTLPEEQLVGNDAQNFLFFDLGSYIKEPYIHAFQDKSERQYFWNYLLKTSLFGEFSFSKKININLAVTISIMSLLIITYSLCGILLLKKEDISSDFIIIALNLFLLLAGAVYLRVSIPYACSNNFRYIMPSLITLCLFFGFSYMHYLKRDLIILEYLGYWLSIIFAICVISFYIYITPFHFEKEIKKQPKVSEHDNSIKLSKLRSLPYLSWTKENVDGNLSGVIRYIPNKSYYGYNLFTNEVDKAFLIDMEGDIVHVWKFPMPGKWEHCELLENGQIVAIEAMKRMVKLDRNSNVIQKIELPIHHDLEVLSDGTILTLVARWREYNSLKVQFDSVLHLSDDFKILDEWSTFLNFKEIQKHHKQLPLDFGKGIMVIEEDKISYNAYDYYHLNSIEVLPKTILGDKDKRFQEGNLLICSRNTNLIFILDKDTKDIVWNYGPEVLDWPHMPTMLQNGNILIFDNGQHRNYSRIIEVNPSSKKIVWQYKASPPQEFHSLVRGSNQRLPNGNILICESQSGRVFEITPQGEIVWEYYNPEIKNKKRKLIYRMMRVISPQKYNWLSN